MDYGIHQINALNRINAISVHITESDGEGIDLQFCQDEDVGSAIDELVRRVENLETAAHLADNVFDPR